MYKGKENPKNFLHSPCRLTTVRSFSPFFFSHSGCRRSFGGGLGLPPTLAHELAHELAHLFLLPLHWERVRGGGGGGGEILAEMTGGGHELRSSSCAKLAMGNLMGSPRFFCFLFFITFTFCYFGLCCVCVCLFIFFHSA